MPSRTWRNRRCVFGRRQSVEDARLFEDHYVTSARCATLLAATEGYATVAVRSLRRHCAILPAA